MIEESVGVVPLKIESASRWREGADGAVNWNTAGPERATLRTRSFQIEFEVEVIRANGTYVTP